MRRFKHTRRHKRRNHKNKRGGDDKDIEMGPDVNIEYMKTVPPDPERFKKYQEKLIKESFNPVSREEMYSVFDRANPEEKLNMENERMMDEDPRMKDPFEVEELKIFDNEGGRKTRRRHKRKTHKIKKNHRMSKRHRK
jgi:hypothetical protein